MCVQPISPVAPSARKKPTRLANIFRGDDGWLVRISEGKEIDFYTLKRLPCDCGLLFEMKKLVTTRTGARAVGISYFVGIDPQEAAYVCDCKGMQFSHHCRHAESLVALYGRGKLDGIISEAIS